MAKNSITSFPASIDDRIFFQDVSLNQVESMNEYQKLIKQNRYTDAAKLLQDSGIDYYGAWILNLLESRLFALETFLQTKTKPLLTTYGGSEPTKEKSHWIE